MSATATTTSSSPRISYGGSRLRTPSRAQTRRQRRAMPTSCEVEGRRQGSIAHRECVARADRCPLRSWACQGSIPAKPFPLLFGCSSGRCGATGRRRAPMARCRTLRNCAKTSVTPAWWDRLRQVSAQRRGAPSQASKRRSSSGDRLARSSISSTSKSYRQISGVQDSEYSDIIGQRGDRNEIHTHWRAAASFVRKTGSAEPGQAGEGFAAGGNRGAEGDGRLGLPCAGVAHVNSHRAGALGPVPTRVGNDVNLCCARIADPRPSSR